MILRVRKEIKKSVHVLKIFLTDKPFAWGLLFVLFQGLNLGPSYSQWGLDPSWGWLTVRAGQLNWWADGSYVWTYGPTFFLDSQTYAWRNGYILAICFRIIVGFLFYYQGYAVTSKLFTKKSHAILLSVLLTTLSFVLFTPSLALIGVFCLYFFSRLWENQNTNKMLFPTLIVVSTVELFNKISQGVLAIILSVGIINLRTVSIKKTVIYFSWLAGLVIAYFYFTGFSYKSFIQYLIGQYELTKGYKAMADEPIGGLWEYIAFVILSFYILYILKRIGRSKIQFMVFILMDLILFEYGFIRHDSHSKTSFYFLLLVIVGLTAVGEVKKPSLSILVFSLCFSIVAQLSFVNLLDVSPRIQGFGNELRLADPRFRNQFLENDLLLLRQNANLSAAMLGEIGTSTVAELPWDQLVGRAYNLNLITPPIPQQYSVYTPWLDKKNATFFANSEAPTFILLSRPTAIDGRNPRWESPLSQLSILCNYKSLDSDSNWLLLQRRSSPVCHFNRVQAGKSEKKQNGEHIDLVNVTTDQNFWERSIKFLFKQIQYEKLSENGVLWNIVSANKGRLISNVPPLIDFPSFWSYGQQNAITPGKNQHLTYSTLEIEQNL
jgi:hypothetical protein